MTTVRTRARVRASRAFGRTRTLFTLSLATLASAACGDDLATDPQLRTGEAPPFSRTSHEVSEPVTSSVARSPGEPAGFSTITDRPFDALEEDGWFTSDEGITGASDASAPVSGPGVLRVDYPAGFGGGESPTWSDREIASLGHRSLYISFAAKLSDGWQGHQTGTNKIGYVWTEGHPAVFFNARGEGSGTLVPTISTQGTPDGGANLVPNVGEAEVRRGEWHRWEALLVLNEGGRANGEVHLWLDGVKVAEYTGLRLASGGSAVWEILTLRPVWGGLGDSVQRGQSLFLDHYYASGGR